MIGAAGGADGTAAVGGPSQPSTPRVIPSSSTTLVGPAAALNRPPSRDGLTTLWCIVSLVFLFTAGGAIFSWLERDAELELYRRNRFLYAQMREMYEFKKCEDAWFKDIEFCKNQKAFTEVLKHFFERSGNEMEDRGKWTFFGAAFYVGILVTTLGYGTLHPVTPHGQLFTVVFGIVGIPLMGYVISHAGSIVVNVWMPMFPSIETRTQRLMVLGSLTVLLIVAGGLLFRLLEGWSSLESFYFSACTLMSVGFGDYAPTWTLSRAATMVFIMLGLGVMASFIALLQITVQIHGEHFTVRLNSWYDAVAKASSTPRIRGASSEEVTA